MCMEKKDMLNALINQFSNGSKTQFANMLGVKPQTISSWITRNTFDTELIYAKCENISADWLITGIGSMLQEDKEKTPIAHKSKDLNSGIPLIPISAMAGAFTGDMQVLYHECETYDIPCFRDADFLISVKGDSMYPTYRSGDIVACRKLIKDNLFFQWNKVYVLDTDQGALIKRIKPGKDEESIMIVSDNESYDPFNLHISHVYNIALVIGLIRIDG